MSDKVFVICLDEVTQRRLSRLTTSPELHGRFSSFGQAIRVAIARLAKEEGVEDQIIENKKVSAN